MTTLHDSLSTRSRTTSSEEELSEPLRRLGEAAAGTTSGSEIVAITRGFDRQSRRRAGALRMLLRESGVTAIEVTAAHPAPKLFSGAPTGDAPSSNVSAVVNLAGEASSQPQRIAANLDVPLLTASESAGDSQQERSVIGVADHDGHRDTALSRIAVRAAESGSGALELDLDGQRRTVTGGEVTVRADGETLQVRVQDAAGTEDCEVKRLELACDDGGFQFVRDELPIADLEGSVTLTAQPNGLTIRTIT